MTEPTADGFRPANKRGSARLAAVQALYQMDVAGTGLLETTAEYELFRLGKEIDGELYRDAIRNGSAPFCRALSKTEDD